MMSFSALADPTRLRITEMLAASRHLSVSEIGKEFTISPPAISQHLKILREANLVKVEINAQQRIYSLNPSGIRQIEDWVSKLKQQWKEQFDTLDALLAKEMKKASPHRRKTK
jgi:DNA-binding transcriptional ArsR family regulator